MLCFDSLFNIENKVEWASCYHTKLQKNRVRVKEEFGHTLPINYMLTLY